MKLIDKDALVAEIEKLKGQLLRGACSSQISMQTRCKEESYDEVLSFLDTLEVKEVDLDKEIDRVWDDTSDKFFEGCWEEFENIAKHFFELGMAVSKV